MASEPLISNCLIADNVSAAEGGGLFNSTVNLGYPRIVNCVIADNVAETGGGLGGFVEFIEITNSIVWGNSPSQIQDGEDVPVTYCNVQGGWPGEGNIDADPLFAFDDNWRILAGSPCIDAGTNDPPGGLPTPDPDGNPRPLDGDGDTVAAADIASTNSWVTRRRSPSRRSAWRSPSMRKPPTERRRCAFATAVPCLCQ